MGHYFDFTPVQPWAGGLGPGLSDLADTILQIHKMKTEDARQKAAQAFTENQAKITQAAEARRAAREQLEFDQHQARMRGETVSAIGKALGAGAFGQAQALGAASQFVNPKTGQLEGVGVAQKPLGPAPGPAPVAPQAPEFVGPLETPEDARARAIARGLGVAPGTTEPPAFDAQANARAQQEGDAAAADVSRQQALRDQFGADSAAYPQALREHQGQVAAYEQRKANPQYTITMPGGQTVDVDPREQQKAAAADARETAGKLRLAAAQPGQAPDVARAMMLQADLIESRASNADKAPVTNMNSAVQAQGFKAGESALDRTNKVEVAKLRKTRSMGRGLGAGAGAGMSELIRMKEEGQPDSAIAARAAELGIPTGGKNGWLPAISATVRGKKTQFAMDERKAGLQATDDQGNPIGEYKSPVDAKVQNERTVAFARVRDRMQALIQDVQENGSRVMTPEAYQRRLNRGKEVQAALRKYNDLGSTDASQRMEEEIQGALGAPGHGFLLGANADTFAHMLHGAERSHQESLNVRLRPGAQQGGAPSAAQSSGGKLTRVRMPDGSVQVFDATGKRVQ